MRVESIRVHFEKEPVEIMFSITGEASDDVPPDEAKSSTLLKINFETCASLDFANEY